jgi:hypothetical protein
MIARLDQAPQESQQAGRRVVRYLPEDKAIDWQGGGSGYGGFSRRKDIMGLGRVCFWAMVRGREIGWASIKRRGF